MTLRDAEQLMLTAVCATIDALELTEKDAAAVKLAKDYAAQIDATRDDAKLHAWALRWIAPLLLAVLESLGATPAARNRLKGGKPADADDAISQLRPRRRGA